MRFPDLEGSATLAAVMVTDAGLGAVTGAVYSAVSVPVVAMVPTAELPFGTPLTDQLTLGSGLPAPVTVATSWTIPAGSIDDMSDGLVATATVTVGAGGVDELGLPPPPQAAKTHGTAAVRTAEQPGRRSIRATCPLGVRNFTGRSPSFLLSESYIPLPVSPDQQGLRDLATPAPHC
jgi:hypothetical protein